MCFYLCLALWLGTLWCLGHLIMQDRDLSMYSPADSSTSKHLSCSSSFCELYYNCKTKRQACPYIVQYLSDNTSTSGSLVEDVLYLASGDELAFGQSVKTPVVIGCGRIQSGGFLNGGAPDGLLGLGFSDISVPSLLAKAGLVQDSFSMCFQSDDSGRIFFGDTGASDQQTTPFLTLNGSRPTYVIGVEGIHVGLEALKISSFKTLIDSGTSFTYLPTDVYKHVTKEFDKQVNYPKQIYEDVPWHYCYRVRSSDSPEVPSVSFTFKGGGNFSVYNPVMPIYTGNGTLDGFCLALEEGPFGIIGQNYMTSYRLVFDRENLRLGWSPSDCYQLEENDGNMAPAPSPQNVGKSRTPLQQQQASPAHAVSPAIAGRTPQIQRSDCVQTQSYSLSSMLFCFAIVAILVSRIGHGGTCSY
uniref:Peptidase A1 domain-containing protein n=1 Tax=Araucaria cunninghamii TaxID=56994 RepID=A0A0D6R263_ARACU